MTLKRKSLIRARTHFFWYTLALVLSMIYIFHAKGFLHCLVVLGLFYVKVKTNMNKYVMWTLFALGTYFVTDYLSLSSSSYSGNVDLHQVFNLVKTHMTGALSTATTAEL